jgi:hypothetical protein
MKIALLVLLPWAFWHSAREIWAKWRNKLMYWSDRDVENMFEMRRIHRLMGYAHAGTERLTAWLEAARACITTVRMGREPCWDAEKHGIILWLCVSVTHPGTGLLAFGPHVTPWRLTAEEAEHIMIEGDDGD